MTPLFVISWGEGEGVQNKKPSVGRVWIFSGTAHYVITPLIENIIRLTDILMLIILLKGDQFINQVPEEVEERTLNSITAPQSLCMLSILLSWHCLDSHPCMYRSVRLQLDCHS